MLQEGEEGRRGGAGEEKEQGRGGEEEEQRRRKRQEGGGRRVEMGWMRDLSCLLCQVLHVVQDIQTHFIQSDEMEEEGFHRLCSYMSPFVYSLKPVIGQCVAVGDPSPKLVSVDGSGQTRHFISHPQHM